MYSMYLKRYRGMILSSVLFFYLGCCITLSLIRIDCATATSDDASKLISSNILDKVEYAVLILSSPENESKRDAIRATWANFVDNIFIENGERLYKWYHKRSSQSIKQEFIKCFFVVGTRGLNPKIIDKITIENGHSKDLLVLENLKDGYINLAAKLVLSLKWLDKNLSQLRYVIKCDDDSFVRIDKIISNLENFAPEMDGSSIRQFVTNKKKLLTYRGLYWGYFDGRAKARLNGKWEEKDWFLCDTYLPYALGGGYVISSSIVEYIAKNSALLSHYNSEDVSMGVWTAALDGINRVHDTRFDTEWISRGCHIDMLVRHKQTPSDMFKMYKRLVHSNGSKLCETESILRNSYSYKWYKLPSECCK